MEKLVEQLRALLGGPLVVSKGTGIASNTPTPTASLSPYHPDYGLTNDTRIRAVRIAETSGVKAAAAECNVAVSTVYRWRNAYATSVINT